MFLECAHVFGTPFQRDRKPVDLKKQVMVSPLSKVELYISMTQPRLYPMFKVKAEIVTSEKLVLKGYAKDTTEESHLFQFEVVPEERNMDFGQLKEVASVFAKSSDPTGAVKGLKALFGTNF